jgi:hypothetical protein
MKKTILRILRFFLKVLVFIYYGILSIRDDIKTKKYADIKFKKDFAGGKVLLLALYEKTLLRNDVIELLKEAKRNDVFIVAVNTLKLNPDNYPKELVDVYIERDNYGRDFGSYKAGMHYFLENGLDDKCERLLILNDSVFFSKKGLSDFVHNLFNTNCEVLGATENSAHSHHLGSFCISVTGNIVRSEKFKQFWKDYKLSNVRPLVIKRGEFALSKTLKSLASSEKHFKSLFDVSFMEKKFKNDREFFQNYHYFRREGESSWLNRTVTSIIAKDEILNSYYKKYILEENNTVHIGKDVNGGTVVIPKAKKDAKTPVVDYLGVVKFFNTYNYHDEKHNEQFERRLTSFYLDEFTLGSQIHINCLALHHCGLPIIKLDLMFRCVCNMNDIIKLRDQLDESQQEDFMDLMLARLCGDRFLIGLNRIAYQFGIL